MTKVEYKKASRPLSEYAEKARKGPIIVVKRGKPFAAVVPIRNADEETVALSTSRKFLSQVQISEILLNLSFILLPFAFSSPEPE